MFNINEQLSAQAGRNWQRANQIAAKSTAITTAVAAVAFGILTAQAIASSARLLQSSIKSTINRLKANQVDQIEIKLNNKAVFKSKSGEKPTINKLSLNDLTAILNSAIADKRENIELLVKADNKIIFISNRGQVELDQLDTFLQTAKESRQTVISTKEQNQEKANQTIRQKLPEKPGLNNIQQVAVSGQPAVLKNAVAPTQSAQKQADFNIYTTTNISSSNSSEKLLPSLNSLEQWQDKAKELGRGSDYLSRIAILTSEFKEGKPLSKEATRAMHHDFNSHKQIQEVVKNARRVLKNQGHSMNEILYHKGEKYSLELQESTDKLTVRSPEHDIIFAYEQGQVQANKLKANDIKAFELIGQQTKPEVEMNYARQRSCSTRIEEEHER